MIDPEKLIESINKRCKNLFVNSIKLRPATGHHNITIYRIEGSSNALNRFEEPFNAVKVLNAFGDFWIYIQVKFISNEIFRDRKRVKEIHTNISISVFQGKEEDDEKHQLFRAEWDDFNNPDEVHSQPHWHITSSQALEKTFSEYSDNFDDGSFLSLLESEKNQVFDVKTIHFAMNGNWQNNDSHIHKILDEGKIVEWFIGVLMHIRTELE
ncbi:hypothetical protein [Winogradskyella sediminis]|uniref:hypothetical protein n=1 Tax=Winogradskyella sediminis TaxID=1382466 RepID=UPI003AA89FDE